MGVTFPEGPELYTVLRESRQEGDFYRYYAHFLSVPSLGIPTMLNTPIFDRRRRVARMLRVPPPATATPVSDLYEPV